MLDTDCDGSLSLKELEDGLKESLAVQAKVRDRKDSANIMYVLITYFNMHKSVIEGAFEKLDEDKQGSLDQQQVQVGLNAWLDKASATMCQIHAMIRTHIYSVTLGTAACEPNMLFRRP